MAGLADLLGLSSASVGPDLTPEQIASLPYVNPPPRPGTGATAPAPAAAPMSSGHSLKDFLGRLGDALYTSAGGRGDGMYRQMQTGQALSGYMTDPQTAMQKLFRVNPDLAAQMLQAQLTATPQYVRDLRAAGIDPSSEEGRRLTELHFGKQPSSSIQNYEYAKANGFTGDFASFVRDYERPQLQSPTLIPAGAVQVGGPPVGGKTVVRTGTDQTTGRKVVQYSDGTIDYAN